MRETENVPSWPLFLKLSSGERNYDIENCELFAMKLELEDWRHWLQWASHPFIVFTMWMLCSACMMGIDITTHTHVPYKNIGTPIIIGNKKWYRKISTLWWRTSNWETQDFTCNSPNVIFEFFFSLPTIIFPVHVGKINLGSLPGKFVTDPVYIYHFSYFLLLFVCSFIFCMFIR